MVVAYGPVMGGFITNPLTAQDQGLRSAENLTIEVVSLSGVVLSYKILAPGKTFVITADLEANFSAVSSSSGHKFSAIVYQMPYEFVASTATFPPASPTTLTQTIPSYLYTEYNDDDDLQAFVDSQNILSQDYVTWFATTYLGVYTSDQIVGLLLDWVGQGIYGYERPSLPSGRNRNIGPLNTYGLNVLGPNILKEIGNQNVYVTTDDIYKRCLTWHLYKGDGKVFNIQWLKRRIMRFLFGVNGTSYNIDSTYPVSVTFGLDNAVNITIGAGVRTVIGGAIPNLCGLNTVGPNQLNTSFVPYPAIPEAVIFQSAIDSGALEVPFQYTWVVNVA